MAVRKNTRSLTRSKSTSTTSSSKSSTRRKRTLKGKSSVVGKKASSAVPKRKNDTDPLVRREKLLLDPWTVDVTPTSVGCGQCRRVIQLDKRDGHQYYRNNWSKHLTRCPDIKRAEGQGLRKEARQAKIEKYGGGPGALISMYTESESEESEESPSPSRSPSPALPADTSYSEWQRINSESSGPSYAPADPRCAYQQQQHHSSFGATAFGYRVENEDIPMLYKTLSYGPASLDFWQRQQQQQQASPSYPLRPATFSPAELAQFSNWAENQPTAPILFPEHERRIVTPPGDTSVESWRLACDMASVQLKDAPEKPRYSRGDIRFVLNDDHISDMEMLEGAAILTGMSKASTRPSEGYMGHAFY